VAIWRRGCSTDLSAFSITNSFRAVVGNLYGPYFGFAARGDVAVPDREDLPPRGPASVISATILEAAAALFVIAALSLTVVDAGGRWLLQSPLRGSSEVTERLVPFVALIGLVVVFASASATIAWPPKSRTASPARYWTWLGPFVGMIVLGAVAVMHLARSSEQRLHAEVSMELALPLAPFSSMSALFALIAVVVAAVAFVRALMRLAPLAPKDPELDI
jgi:uncharacterized membrane protein YidH (DUF202 family)